jgi:hypothetical protein
VAGDAIDESKLRHWNLIEEFQKALQAVEWPEDKRSPSERERVVQQGEYLSLFLFGLFNPVVRTMRAVTAASRLDKVQGEISQRRISKSTFTEMQYLVDPQRLEKVFENLAERELGKSPGLDPRLTKRTWLAQDGSLFRALPRMAWALYGVGPDGQAKGVRLHLTFNLTESKPQGAEVTVGAGCERQVLRERIKKGEAYVGDRHFSGDYSIFAQFQAKECSYVFRLKENAAITLVEELEVTDEDRAQGIVRQAWVRLGATLKTLSVRVRVLWLESASEGSMMLVTNLAVTEASAQLVEHIYRWRWQIELFFRWVKYILGMRGHWFAESPRGVQIQMYLTLIAALLMRQHFGMRPTKRMMEMLQFYLLGIATSKELSRELGRELASLAARKRTKS